MDPGKRGALVVLEGCDRTGKTSQAQILYNRLTSHGLAVRLWKFPSREGAVGSLLDEYLRGKTELCEQTVHLLFSADRWAKQNELINLLNDGVTVLIDRYAYSGVAFSAAKGMDLEWCRASDRGILSPDCVIFLDSTNAVRQKRAGFGAERFEVPEFQELVSLQYLRIREKDTVPWFVFDADQDREDLAEEIFEKVFPIVTSEKKGFEKMFS